MLYERLDVDRVPQRIWTEAGIVHDFEGGTVPLRSEEGEMFDQLAVGLDCDYLRDAGAGRGCHTTN